MTAKQQVYSCSECGQLVAVVHQGGGRLVCHGKPMMQAGEEKAGAARTRPAARSRRTRAGDRGGNPVSDELFVTFAPECFSW